MSNNALPTIKDEAERGAEESEAQRIQPLRRQQTIARPALQFARATGMLVRHPRAYLQPTILGYGKYFLYAPLIHGASKLGLASLPVPEGSTPLPRPDVHFPQSLDFSELQHFAETFGRFYAEDFVQTTKILFTGIFALNLLESFLVPLVLMTLYAAVRPGLDIHNAPKKNMQLLHEHVAKQNSHFITLENQRPADPRVNKLVAGMMPELAGMGMSDIIIEPALADRLKGYDSQKTNGDFANFFAGKISAQTLRTIYAPETADILVAARAAGIRVWVVDPRGDNKATQGSIHHDFLTPKPVNREIARRTKMIAAQARGRVGIFYSAARFKTLTRARGILNHFGPEDSTTRVSIFPRNRRVSTRDFLITYRDGAVHADLPTAADPEAQRMATPLIFGLMGGRLGQRLGL